MTMRRVWDCDCCGVKDIRSHAGISLGGSTVDLCAECAHEALRIAGPAIDPEMVDTLKKRFAERKAKGDFEPL